MTVLASGSKGNSTVISSARTRILVDAGLSCRELLRRMEQVGEDPAKLTAILVTHEHQDHVAGLAVLARRLRIPVFFTEQTHRAWVRMLTPKSTMSYAQWLDMLQREREEKARATAQAPAHIAMQEGLALGGARRQDGGYAAVETAPAEIAAAVGTEAGVGTEAAVDIAASGEADPDFALPVEAEEPCEPEESRAKARVEPSFLPEVEYFRAGHEFAIGDIDVSPFTIPHDAADPCGFVFHTRSETLRMAVVTDLGYIPPNVKMALKNVDVLLLESNHDLEMLKDGPYPWSVKQRVLSRVGHLSNDAAAEFLLRDYDGGAHSIVLGHLSESNNLPELARLAAEQAVGDRMRLLGNRIVLAMQDEPLPPISL